MTKQLPKIVKLGLLTLFFLIQLPSQSQMLASVGKNPALATQRKSSTYNRIQSLADMTVKGKVTDTQTGEALPV
ncbi:MAG: hypothetical protein R2822_17135 [Spirosomataceae bacterium]